MKALDTSQPTIGMAQALYAQGYRAVGVYLRPDRCSAPMVSELRHAGFKLWSMYEKGYPTSPAYFTEAQGLIDGHAATAFAKQVIAQPGGSSIYACVDYDADAKDPKGPTINGAISAYMRAFKSAVEQVGYVASVYGSGRTCRILTAAGLAKAGWLSLSSGWAEHGAYAPHAAIVQLRELNRSWDLDEVQDSARAGLW